MGQSYNRLLSEPGLYVADSSAREHFGEEQARNVLTVVLIERIGRGYQFTDFAIRLHKP
jgi:hypothetical protein